MSFSDHKKILNQIENKSGKVAKYEKHNVPANRSTGVSKIKCSRCGRVRGITHKYGLNLCRHCLREVHTEIGFNQYS